MRRDASSYEAAVVLLAARDRTRSELSRLLAARGFAQSESDAALDRLSEKGLLDDTRYAGAWARSRLRAKPMGRLRLKQELEEKGVQTRLVTEVLKDLYENGEETVARRAAASKLVGLRRLPAASRPRYLARFLQRRGFSTDVIRELLCEEQKAEWGRPWDG